MINKINENNHTKKENDLETYKKNDLINLLTQKLKISEEIIKEKILKQNKEIFNIKNRLNSEVEKYNKFSLEKLIIEFLLIIDNIERAFNLIKQKKEKEYVEISKNIEYVLTLINNIFTELKISKIHHVKVIFNPDIHQAISIKNTNKYASNQIIEVMQSGYIMHNSRLLRPAMVVVSKNPKNNS